MIEQGLEIFFFGTLSRCSLRRISSFGKDAHRMLTKIRLSRMSRTLTDPFDSLPTSGTEQRKNQNHYFLPCQRNF